MMKAGDFVKATIASKFLRTWAYNGFYELAKQHRQYHEYAMEQLDHGEAEKSAAIKDRIRNIRKAMKEISQRRLKTKSRGLTCYTN